MPFFFEFLGVDIHSQDKNRTFVCFHSLVNGGHNEPTSVLFAAFFGGVMESETFGDMIQIDEHMSSTGLKKSIVM